MSDLTEIPRLECVECGRQYTEDKREMLLNPWSKKKLKAKRITLKGTYDGCLWP